MLGCLLSFCLLVVISGRNFFLSLNNQLPKMSPIGFIGIGIMGKGMLKNLATKLDTTFVIWNRSAFFVNQGLFLS